MIFLLPFREAKLDTGVHVLPVLQVKMLQTETVHHHLHLQETNLSSECLGSSMSIAGANFVLNTIVADTLQDFADELEGADRFR